MFTTMNDISWDGTVDNVSTRKPSRFENDEFIKAKAEPWICYFGMYPDPLTAAAIDRQTIADKMNTGVREAGDTTRSTAEILEQSLQTAQMIASLAQTVVEWKESEETRNQWISRNTSEFAIKENQRNKERANALAQQGLSKESQDLDRRDIDLSRDKVWQNQDRVDVENVRRGLNEDKFLVDNAAARTKRDATGAGEYAEEGAAGVAGTAVADMHDYLGALGARTGEYVDEATAFTDPLLAAAPGSTVGGSRYGRDFAAASGPAAYARDSRKAEIAAFAAAMGKSTDSLAGIDMGKATQGAQQDRINREVGLAGADQSLASAGLRDKITQLGKKDTDIDKLALNTDLASLMVDKDRTTIDQRMDNTRMTDLIDKLNSQDQLDKVAKAHKKTLRGQQSVMFPGSQLLGQASNLAGQFKPAKTQISKQQQQQNYNVQAGAPATWT